MPVFQKTSYKRHQFFHGNVHDDQATCINGTYVRPLKNNKTTKMSKSKQKLKYKLYSPFNPFKQLNIFQSNHKLQTYSHHHVKQLVALHLDKWHQGIEHLCYCFHQR